MKEVCWPKAAILTFCVVSCFRLHVIIESCNTNTLAVWCAFGSVQLLLLFKKQVQNKCIFSEVQCAWRYGSLKSNPAVTDCDFHFDQYQLLVYTTQVNSAFGAR